MTDARILIVDDHPVARNGMAEVIGQYDGLRVSGRAATVQEGLRLLDDNDYDLAVVDLALEELELIKQIVV